ncbi:iron-siderophore ABC transporter substrate-binding protein [Saccharomonospora xinjiangensis]|uniref:iron-siderophore ABC transporter substrate-binding protein n=1 Tax=Saccharomonospora xinjiangensis TaxID=75294 RepID=UPI001FFCBB06|nr:iron-siderophore ABC transporter substrate-binding protein [Saccharomonospora xinjiangensis]
MPAWVPVWVLALVVAGCGAPADDARGAGAPPVPAAEPGAFPVTIEHKYGSTEITEAPKRVVTLGLSDQDAALALGVKPVGVIDWFGERPYGAWPWTEKRWGSYQPTIVGERDEYAMERIAALEPDLIVAQYSGMSRQQYDSLSRIADVVAQPGRYPDYAAPWQEMTRRIGTALGFPARTERLIEETEEKFAEVREEHPEFAQQTVAVADSFEPGKYSAFTSSDPKAIFFEDLGFELHDRIDDIAEDGANVAELSAERLDVLDVDRLIWVTSSEEANERIRAEPMYQRLAVHAAGRDVFVPYEDPDIGAAFSFNTVLSIPYAIDEMVPRLVAGNP